MALYSNSGAIDQISHILPSRKLGRIFFPARRLVGIFFKWFTNFLCSLLSRSEIENKKFHILNLRKIKVLQRKVSISAFK